VTVTYSDENILLCGKPRTAGITIIFVQDKMTVPNPSRQSCGSIVIYIWCIRNATLTLIEFLWLVGFMFLFWTGVINLTPF